VSLPCPFSSDVSFVLYDHMNSFNISDISTASPDCVRVCMYVRVYAVRASQTAMFHFVCENACTSICVLIDVGVITL